MKKIFLSLIFLGIASGTYALAAKNEINCLNVIEGEDVGGKFETKAKFESTAPIFNDLVIVTLTGSSPIETKTTYLTDKKVCGLDIDFSKNCKFEEKSDPKFGYEFTFKCGAEVMRGSVYCDENCLTKDGGGLNFRCEGPKVDKKLSGSGLAYQGCKFKVVP